MTSIKMLLAAGADGSIKDMRGKKAFQYSTNPQVHCVCVCVCVCVFVLV